MYKIMKHHLTKNREVIAYLIVGVCTTAVGWGTKFLWNFVFFSGTSHPNNIQNVVLSTVNWVAGVAFAYPTNRKWVFRSNNTKVLSEVIGFVTSRAGTWIIDILIMQLLGNVIGLDIYISTIIAAVIVVVLNYVISKLVIFRSGDQQ